MWQWKGAPRAMGPLTQPHPWLWDPEWGWHPASLALVVYRFHQHLLCFSKEATKKQITRIRPIRLATLLNVLGIWSPPLKKQYLLQFHEGKRMHHHCRGFRKLFAKGFQELQREEWLGSCWAASVTTWAFSKEIPQEEKQWQLCDLRQESLSTMVSTPFRAIQPLSLTLEMYIPSNALFVSLLATWW